MDTLQQLADYHYVSLSVINRLKARGVNVHNHMAVEYEILNQSHRAPSWVSGNPNRHGVKFPSCGTFKERDKLICYCEDKEYDCVSCRADWDFGSKYAMRLIESGNWPTQAEVDELVDS
jgi:hypothetical protein